MKFNADEDGTLLELLEKAYVDSSRRTLRSWIKHGRVLVDGRKAKQANLAVSKGQEFSVARKVEKIENRFPILFEDKHLVIINKPAGLLSVATDFIEGDTAHGILKRNYRPQKIHVVHRLDRDTSGVMLFARSEEAKNGLKDLFEAHDLQRQYIAVVEGRVEPKEGTWTSYLWEDGNYVVRTTDDKRRGQKATTHYKVIKQSKNFSLLSVTLETGKKNQVRVQCQEAGHPVVGDKKYGSRCNKLGRLGLHAQLLELEHPVTKRPLRFQVDAPWRFQSLLKNDG